MGEGKSGPVETGLTGLVAMALESEAQSLRLSVSWGTHLVVSRKAATKPKVVRPRSDLIAQRRYLQLTV